MGLFLLLAALVVSQPQANVIYQVGAVTEDSPKQAATAVELAKQLGTGLTIELDGMGGNVGYGFEMADVLRKSHLELTCVVHKYAMSMNAWLMEIIPCHRQMNKNALLVFHKPIVIRKAAEEVGLDKKGQDEQVEYALRLLCVFAADASHGNMEVSECIEILNKNEFGIWVFNAPHAREKGQIDEVTP